MLPPGDKATLALVESAREHATISFDPSGRPAVSPDTAAARKQAELFVAASDEEATPTLQPVPGIDLNEYQHTLIEWFSNEHIRDTLARLCAESSDRLPKWLLPVIRINLEQGGEVRRSAAIVASWARYDEGIDEQGNPINVVDQLKESLMATAALQRQEPLAFISNREIFGDLVDNEPFVTAYAQALNDLHHRGARVALESLNSHA